ncbi:hypothetical protein [Gellertiella hungarica]|uniref:Uncharacterized protein (TIGR02588 family) n=1 Tax=Gellertiella hungarica TaxID=1572859 RepID=A0A7W6J1Q8_9HYPH|nr:hypothetical protein [Gellertiella hungarica]MBB4063194.1 uncharacterized protein (TIGR02588 family) [Gellertiella hungarica]
MSHVEDDEQEDKPLDPVMEKVRRKMVRLQLVSAGIMVVMLMAVLGAIVYKLTRPDPRAAAVAVAGAGIPVGETVKAVASLPAGFAVRSVSLSGGQLLIHGNTADAQQQALVFDIASGRIVAEITLR